MGANPNCNNTFPGRTGDDNCDFINDYVLQGIFYIS